MREIGGGSIVNFSSTAFLLGIANLSVYSAAKAAIVGMTKSLAREFGPDNVRVNAILPGAVVTERQRRLWLNEDDIRAIVARQCLAVILAGQSGEELRDKSMNFGISANPLIRPSEDCCGRFGHRAGSARRIDCIPRSFQGFA
jgi:NAD(P)-dependent dehydrogenase (short-subunit alcohol dehydrogenase family)